MGVPAGPFVCDGLLFQADRIVLPWLAERIPGSEGRLLVSPQFPASSIGLVEADAGGHLSIRGGVAYSFWFDHSDGGDCQISMFFDPAARLTRRMLRHLCGHAFVTMRCRRVSMQVRKDDRAMRRRVERLGWVREACKPEADGRHALVLYGLLRRNLRNGLPPIKSKGSLRHG